MLLNRTSSALSGLSSTLVRRRLKNLEQHRLYASEPKPRTKVKLICEYDGLNYSGWAKSPTNPKPCIHGAIEESFKKLFPQTQFLAVKSASRTDAGVSALGQVIAIESEVEFGGTPVLGERTRPSNEERRIEKKHARTGPQVRNRHINSNPGTAEELYRRLNSFLPPDIVLHSSKRVPLSFDVKEHSVRRKYRYEILNRPLRCAIGREHVWHIKDRLDTHAMQEAAKILIGTNNMSCFCPSFYLPKDTSKVHKTIESSEIIVSEDGTRIAYEIVGKSFMYRQVRNTVGALVEIGRGRLSISQLHDFIANGKRVAIQGAPAPGLTLVWCEHDPDTEIEK